MDNKSKVQSFLKLLTEQKVQEAFANYISPEFKHHNQHTKAGRQSLLDGMTEAHSQFPAMTIDVKRIFEDADFVITHSLVKMDSGHPGFICVHIFRFYNGKITEFWDLASPMVENSLNVDGPF